MKILFTGFDGFIGSHLTEELVKQGYEVKAFVYYNSFNTWGMVGYLAALTYCHTLLIKRNRGVLL